MPTTPCVTKAGKQWAGATQIDGKYRNPAWSPPAEVKHDKPSIPDLIPGGSPHNPMGVAAMTLADGHTQSTAPTYQARSAASSPMAASACKTPTSPTSLGGFRSARRLW
jgi:hypothetical protein